MVSNFDDIATIEARLYPQLVLFAAVFGFLAFWWGGWRSMVAVGMGTGVASAYYRLLAWDLRSRGEKRKSLSFVSAMGGVVFRQVICAAIPALCFIMWGSPGLVSLLALLVARHWIFFVAWPRESRSTPAYASSVGGLD